jgi:hypothetical protein
MNTISYEGIVPTRRERLHRAAVNRCVALLERTMRVRIEKIHVCLRALRATLASFRMAAARSSAASNCLATADPLCNRDGDRRNS